MKHFLLLSVLVFLLANVVKSQTYEHRLLIGGGKSMHGTGDLPGYSFFNQLDIQLNKRFFLSPGIQFTNHADKYYLSEFELNYVTAGTNIFTNINYFILNKTRHQVAIGAGPLLRFQNSSVPSYVASGLGASGAQVLTLQYDKLRSTSFGYNISPSYYYQFSTKCFLGAKLILQNDTEADVILSSMALIGIKL